MRGRAARLALTILLTATPLLVFHGVVVQDILRDPAQLARLRAIHAVCCKVGTRSIAEFVEERETLSTLRKIGVHFVQGFGVERPQLLQS